MSGKISLIFLAFCVCQAYSLTEIRLDERTVHYVRHDTIGTTISIAKPFWDTLSSCHVIFPNNVMYEAYPQNRLPSSQNVYFLQAIQPFVSCGIGFRNIGPEFSGSYELLSTVLHTSDNSVSLTRQRFNLIVREEDFN